VRTAFALALSAIALAVSAGAAAKALPGFRSPSKNITCLLQTDKPEFVTCGVAQADYATKLRHHCAAPPIGVDWAGFSLGQTGKGEVECTGGTLYDPGTEHPHYVVLAYGATWKQGGFTCSSKTTGVTCTNGHGHGIFLSRASYRTW
jgi:hypothetical protein